MQDCYTVYLLYNAGGILLYVGVTGRPLEARLLGHRNMPWWPDVAEVQSEQHTDRRRAYRREIELIRDCRPRHNAAYEDLRLRRLAQLARGRAA